MIPSNAMPEDQLQREALAWLSHVALGGATRDDLAALRRWRDLSPDHASALARAGQLWHRLEAPVAALVRDGVDGRAERFHASRRAFITGSAIAACAAAGAAMIWPPLELWPSVVELAADRRTGVGEQMHVSLGDAIKVELNTRTSVALRSEAQGGGIELISGEAAVVVDGRGAKPFVVAAADGRITASQATFDVRRSRDYVTLTCVDGEVAVECKGRNTSVGPSQVVSYNNRGLGTVAAIDPAVVTAWRDGMLVFRNTPLATVIDEVNRYRPGKILLMDRDLGHRLVTARFEIKRLDTVMGQIGHVFKVPVKAFPGGLVLVG